MSLDKIRKVGFSEEFPVGEGRLRTFERIAKERIIPPRGAWAYKVESHRFAVVGIQTINVSASSKTQSRSRGIWLMLDKYMQRVKRTTSLAPNSRVCCLVNESCLSNGLCYGSPYNLAYRGACTDREWPENECPHVCYTEVSTSFADIRPGPGNPRGFATRGPSGWVTEICEWNLSTFRWPPARVLVAQLVNVSASAAETGTATRTVTVTASSSASANPDSNTDANLATAIGGRRDCSDTERRFGAGLGLGLGIPLVAVSIALVMSRVRAKRTMTGAGVVNPAGVFGPQNIYPI
ncbi:hypothetical protein BJX68DRAFT_273407 [Aspergillus pseudodeflectus]|uniref:ShKT domain-containing protein n=1 Tax=Aspergillus pseudodeflectus TaxID=176178 RepID=A0ABR4J9G6_9EURO